MVLNNNHISVVVVQIQATDSCHALVLLRVPLAKVSSKKRKEEKRKEEKRKPSRVHYEMRMNNLISLTSRWTRYAAMPHSHECQMAGVACFLNVGPASEDLVIREFTLWKLAIPWGKLKHAAIHI